MLGWVQRFVSRLERIPYSGWLLVAVPVVVGLSRSVLESFILGYRAHVLASAFNYVMFYVALQQLFIVALAVATSKPAREVTGAVSVGLVLAWLPPILDMAGLGTPGKGFFYFTEFRWHFFAPYQSLGESLTIWISIAFGVGYVAYTTRSAVRGAVALGTMWVVGQVLGWLVTVVAAFLARDPGIASLTLPGITNLLFFLIAFAAQSVLHCGTLLPSLLRVNHCVPFALCTAIAGRMTGAMEGALGARALVILVGGLLIVIANDYYDKEQDERLGRTGRPATRDDMIVATFYQALIVAWGIVVEPRSAVFLILFFLLPFFYHHPTFRLKRLFCAAYLIEGATAVCSFLFGMGSVRFGTALQVTPLLVLGGFALGSMFKDYKDVEEDRAERMGTIYTRLMARGRSLAAVHLGVSLAILLALLVPPVWLVGRGEPFSRAAALFVLAAAMLACLLIGKDRRKVVERSFWCLSLYLLALLVLVPQLG